MARVWKQCLLVATLSLLFLSSPVVGFTASNLASMSLVSPQKLSLKKVSTLKMNGMPETPRSSTNLKLLPNNNIQRSHFPTTTTTSTNMSSQNEHPSTSVTPFKTFTTITVNLFPLWTVLCTLWALSRPSHFLWFTTEYFTAGLALLMLSMGITLTPGDFARVGKRPNSVFLQFALCYFFMPVLAMVLGVAFGLSPSLLAGMVLVGATNGGQASNLCTYIAKGNVALSVIMTTATTVGAIIFTPLLCKLLLGTVVPVDAAGIAKSTIQVVLGPIAVGMLANKYTPGTVKTILPIAPLVGIFSTCLLVASAVAQVSASILTAGWSLQLPVLLLHLVGGLGGYFIPRMLGFGEAASRTMAIETSMKSSAFGFLLAKLHFGEYAARIPPAVSVVWMALSGSLMAVIWRYIPVKPSKTFDRGLVEKYPPFSLRRFLGMSEKKD